MTYEQAFTEGERAAFQDRRSGVFRHRPSDVLTPWAAAWWDGYTPRTSAWAVRPSFRVPEMAELA